MNPRLWLSQNYGALVAFVVFIIMFSVFIGFHSAGLTVPVVNTAANKAVLAALTGMASSRSIVPSGA